MSSSEFAIILLASGVRQLDCPGPMPTIAKLPRRLPGKSISGSFDIEIARVAFLVFVFGTSNLP